MKSRIRLAAFLLAFFTPLSAFAHEAYVLQDGFFWSELAKPYSLAGLAALRDPGNVRVTLLITLGIMAAFVLNYFFRRSRAGERVNRTFEQFAPFGPLFVRAAIAAAFFYSALSWSFLGPELSLTVMPYAALLRYALFAASGLIALGLFTELAALAALIMFTIGFFVFGSYLMTYLNYLGEIITLLLFGTRKWSFDALIFGTRSRFPELKKYESTIIRICYGLALTYAAITVKFLHPALTIEVVNRWNLTQFHWLFPHDPLLVTLGAGLSEAAIGLFILIGFEMRLTILISLFYITLSLLYFRELVWPHLMLYGISLNLLVQPEVLALDRLLYRRKTRDDHVTIAP